MRIMNSNQDRFAGRASAKLHAQQRSGEWSFGKTRGCASPGGAQRLRRRAANLARPAARRRVEPWNTEGLPRARAHGRASAAAHVFPEDHRHCAAARTIHAGVPCESTIAGVVMFRSRSEKMDECRCTARANSCVRPLAAVHRGEYCRVPKCGRRRAPAYSALVFGVQIHGARQAARGSPSCGAVPVRRMTRRTRQFSAMNSSERPHA